MVNQSSEVVPIRTGTKFATSFSSTDSRTGKSVVGRKAAGGEFREEGALSLERKSGAQELLNCSSSGQFLGQEGQQQLAKVFEDGDGVKHHRPVRCAHG